MAVNSPGLSAQFRSIVLCLDKFTVAFPDMCSSENAYPDMADSGSILLYRFRQAGQLAQHLNRSMGEELI
jgi:hypothetical protein